MRVVPALTLLIVTLLGGGCGVDDGSNGDGLGTPSDQLTALQNGVLEQTRDVVDVLRGAGLEISRSAGVAEYCQSEPAPGVTYRAGGAVAGTPDEAPDQFTAARQALLDHGWQVDTEGMDGARPWANLTRDDYRLGLSQAKHRERLLGFSIRRKDDCIRTDDDLLDEDRRRVDIVGDGASPSG